MENKANGNAEEKQEIAMKNMKAQWEEIVEQTEGGPQQTDYSYQGAAGNYRYEPSPREYLHNFLLQANQSGCNVERYILDEINLLLAELKR